MDKKSIVKEYTVITICILIVAAGLFLFFIPGKIVTGSVTGLSMILAQVLPFKISLINLVLNIMVLALGFLLIGREFGAKTVYTTLVLSLALVGLEALFPNLKSLTGDVILDALCGILLLGIGQAELFRLNASSGGLDIVAQILHKYFHVDLGAGLAISGIITVCLTIFVYDVRILIIGILVTYAKGRVVDHFIDGFFRKRKVCIISEQYVQVQEYVLKELHRGVTMHTIIGGYSGKERCEIEVILDKREYVKLMTYLEQKDKNAFVTVSAVSEVVGNWYIDGHRTRLKTKA